MTNSTPDPNKYICFSRATDQNLLLVEDDIAMDTYLRIAEPIARQINATVNRKAIRSVIRRAVSHRAKGLMPVIHFRGRDVATWGAPLDSFTVVAPEHLNIDSEAFKQECEELAKPYAGFCLDKQ